MSLPVEIGEASPDDELGVLAIVAAAFGRHDEARLVAALRQDGAIVLSLVAKLQGLVIGACVFSRVRLQSQAGEAPGVALAPLAVAPAFQTCGVGTRLVQVGLETLKARGEATVLVVGEPSYYGRFGFSSEAAGGVETPWDVGDYLQALALAGEPPGAGRAVYAAAFAALE